MRLAARLPLALMIAAAIAAPAAQAAGPTATTAAPAATTQPAVPAQPGQAFSSPIEGLIPRQTQTAPTVTTVARPDDKASGQKTLLILSIVALVMIFSVAGIIWYENRHGNDKRKRRHRMRSGRTPQTAAAGAEGRRGPPPPPRKRRAQAKRKKR